MPLRDTSSTGTTSGNNITNPQITIPATAQVNDVAFVFISASVTTGLTAPAGWTEHAFTVSTGNCSLHSWWKVIDGDDAGATVTFTGTSQQRRSLACLVFSGVNTTTPVHGDTPAGIAYTNTTTNRNAPDTTLTGTRDVISAVGSAVPPSPVYGTPSGFTAGPKAYNTGSGGADVGTVYIDAQASGSLDGDVWTADASQGGACVQMIVLNPATQAATVTPRHGDRRCTGARTQEVPHPDPFHGDRHRRHAGGRPRGRTRRHGHPRNRDRHGTPRWVERSSARSRLRQRPGSAEVPGSSQVPDPRGRRRDSHRGHTGSAQVPHLDSGRRDRRGHRSGPRQAARTHAQRDHRGRSGARAYQARSANPADESSAATGSWRPSSVDHGRSGSPVAFVLGHTGCSGLHAGPGHVGHRPGSQSPACSRPSARIEPAAGPPRSTRPRGLHASTHQWEAT